MKGKRAYRMGILDVEILHVGYEMMVFGGGEERGGGGGIWHYGIRSFSLISAKCNSDQTPALNKDPEPSTMP